MEVTAPAPPDFPTSYRIKKKVESVESTPPSPESNPEIVVKRSGGKTDQTGISIDGLKSKNINLEVNGMIWETPEGGIDFFTIPGEISSITIIPGYSTGSGSATIKIDTKLNKNDFSISAGSDNLFSARISLSNGDDNSLKLGVSTGFITTKGNYPFINNRGTYLNPDDDIRERRKNNSFRRGGLTLLVQKGDFAFLYGYSNLTRGDPGLVTFPGYYTHLHYTGSIFITSWKWDNGRIWVGHGRGRESFYDPYGEFTGFAQSVTTDFSQSEAGFSSVWHIKRDYFFKSTLRARDFKLNNSVTGEHLRNTLNGHLSLIKNGEVAVISLDLNYLTDFHYQLISPAAGIKLSFSKITMSSNFVINHRLPTMYELYYSHGIIEGNPDLEPEKSFYTDLNFAGKFKLKPHLRVFYQSGWNQIDYFLISGFRYKPLGLSTSWKIGANLSIAYQDKFLSTKFSTVYLKTNYTRGSINGEIPYLPRWNVTLLIKSRTNPYISIFGIFQNRIYLNLSNTKYIENQWRCDLSGGIQMGKFSLEVSIYNLFQTSFYTYRGFPTPLYQWEVRVRWKG